MVELGRNNQLGFQWMQKHKEKTRILCEFWMFSSESMKRYAKPWVTQWRQFITLLMARPPLLDCFQKLCIRVTSWSSVSWDHNTDVYRLKYIKSQGFESQILQIMQINEKMFTKMCNEYCYTSDTLGRISS